MTIERIISKLHVAPNPNSKFANDEMMLLLIPSGKNLDILRTKPEFIVCAQEGFFSKMH